MTQAAAKTPAEIRQLRRRPTVGGHRQNPLVRPHSHQQGRMKCHLRLDLGGWEMECVAKRAVCIGQPAIGIPDCYSRRDGIKTVEYGGDMLDREGGQWRAYRCSAALGRLARLTA